MTKVLLERQLHPNSQLITIHSFGGIVNNYFRLSQYDEDNTDNNINSVVESIDIESIDLDTALTLENRVDWLIIDIEGFEVNVLNGARSTLRKYSPK